MSTALDLLPETTLEAPFKWDKPFKERWHTPDETAKNLLGFFGIGVVIAGMFLGIAIQNLLIADSLGEVLNTILAFSYGAAVGLPAILLMRKHLIKVKARWWNDYLAFRKEKGAVLAAAIKSLNIFTDDESIAAAADYLATNSRSPYPLFTPEGYKYQAELFNGTVLLHLRGKEIHEKIQEARRAAMNQEKGVPAKSALQVKAEQWVASNPGASLTDAYIAGNQK